MTFTIAWCNRKRRWRITTAAADIGSDNPPHVTIGRCWQLCIGRLWFTITIWCEPRPLQLMRTWSWP